MYKVYIWFLNSWLFIFVFFLTAPAAESQIGKRFPPEKRIITDTVTGARLTFLTSSLINDYLTPDNPRQWTADGKWLIFRSLRLPGETLAVNENTGDIVQVTDGGYMPVMCLSAKSMKMYYMRMVLRQPGQTSGGPVQVVEVDLERLFSDSGAGTLKAEKEYQKVCGIIPAGMSFGNVMALDADDEWVYFILSEEEAAKHNPVDPAAQSRSGIGMALKGEAGIGRISLTTRETEIVVVVPFGIAGLQSDPRNPGEIIFSCETGEGAPQETWTVRSDGSCLKPLSTPQENVSAVQGAPEAGLRHFSRPADVHWSVADDLAGNIYLINTQSNEMLLLSSGHLTSVAVNPHPSFSPDGTRIVIRSGMLSGNNRSTDICLIPLTEKE